ncbi:MAG: uroporphyrinogen-III C-methyltransferase [Rhodospirillaceae bacterium]
MSNFDNFSGDKFPGAAPFGSRAGRVTLVGAGPGDPELLTVKGYLALKAADVVFFDDLVSPEILDILPQGARCIYVGKPYQGAGISQADIIGQLAAAARGGHRVVRLKGGDPMVFGRSGEELEGLRAAGIAVDIVPGITAATGAAASARITLTHRDYAAQVSFVTAARRDGSLADVNGLAGLGRTLVIYMGIARAAALSEALQADGVAASWPIAIVENATRSNERVIVTTVAGLPAAISEYCVRSPALFIVGEVVKTYVPAQAVAEETVHG